MKQTMLITLSMIALAFAGCTGTGGGDVAIYGEATGGTLKSNEINQRGSSTVLPLAEAWASDFGVARAVNVKVASGGSGAGASGICNGEVDLGDMSRGMKDSEKDKCASNGVTPVEFKVAFDGLSVVVSNKNSFATDLTIEQLNLIFRENDYATNWNEVDPSFPNQNIALCFPDEDSGTYEYFNEEILGKGAHPRSDDAVEQSANDNVLVACVKDNQYAIGYFGFAYLLENQNTLKSVAVEGVHPSFDSIANGQYSPLSRPLYIYTDGTPDGLLNDYFQYVFHPEGGQALIADVGYVALDENTRQAMLNQL